MLIKSIINHVLLNPRFEVRVKRIWSLKIDQPS